MLRMTRPEVSPRGDALLRCVAGLGPLFFVQIRRALPAFAPDLPLRKTTNRLLYRELSLLVRKRLIGIRRPAGARAGVYHVTERGAGLLEGKGAGPVDVEGIVRFLARPAHEELVRGLAVELVLARALHGQVLTSLAWSFVERFASTNGQGDYVPDLVGWLGLGNKLEWVLLCEIDRGTEPLGRWEAKLDRAAPVLASCGPTGRLLVLAEGKRRLQLLAERARTVGQELASRMRWALPGDVTAEALLEPRFLAIDDSGSHDLRRVHLLARAA